MPKILIVDDQAAVRTALDVLFQVHGLETVSASSPAEASPMRPSGVSAIETLSPGVAQAASGAEGCVTR